MKIWMMGLAATAATVTATPINAAIVTVTLTGLDDSYVGKFSYDDKQAPDYVDNFDGAQVGQYHSTFNVDFYNGGLLAKDTTIHYANATPGSPLDYSGMSVDGSEEYDDYENVHGVPIFVGHYSSTYNISLEGFNVPKNGATSLPGSGAYDAYGYYTFNKGFTLGSSGTSDSDRIAVRATAVSTVPETATWGMLILGFFAVGSVIRRAMRKSEEEFTTKVRADFI